MENNDSCIIKKKKYEYNNKKFEIPISKALFGPVGEVPQQHEGQLALNDGWWSYTYSSICYCHYIERAPLTLLPFPPPPRFPQFFFIDILTNTTLSHVTHSHCRNTLSALHSNKHRHRHRKQNKTQNTTTNLLSLFLLTEAENAAPHRLHRSPLANSSHPRRQCSPLSPFSLLCFRNVTN